MYVAVNNCQGEIQPINQILLFLTQPSYYRYSLFASHCQFGEPSKKQERMAFHRGGLLLLISHEISYQSIHELHTGINMTKPYNVKINLNSRTVKYDNK